MSRDATALEAVVRRLRASRSELAVRPARERLDAVCAVLELWRRSDSPYRRALEEKLPAASGFHPETVRAGLELGLAHWSGDALREMVTRELHATDSGGMMRGPSVASGFPLTSVLLGGSIPMPTLLSLLLPLLLGSPVLAKPASRDPVTAGLVAESIAEVDSLLGRAVAVHPFAHDDEAAANLFFASECVVATGSDETLARIAARVTPPQRLVAYGHRLSLAIVGEAAPNADALEEIAEGLAMDVALWDQLGCLSPLAVLALGEGSHAEATATALAEALEEAGQRWPHGEISTAAAAEIRRERSEAEMRGAGGRAVRVFADDALGWTVVLEDDARWRPAPLHRFVRVIPVADREELFAAIEPLGPHLAGIALAGIADEARDLTRRLVDLGASRVCGPGRLQAPPLGWRHDGQSPLLPLARLGDDELG